jgi:hypothetical protein
MTWNTGEILFVILAAGYVALGLYGKWRKLKEDYLIEREKRLALAEAEADADVRPADPDRLS